MKIWHISDPHTNHDLLVVPEDIDAVICSGDISNPRDLYTSNNQCMDFIEWYEKLPIKNKILIAGNHDIAIWRRAISPEFIRAKGIIYLENDFEIIDGITIWGSPYTPSFGDGWAFNKDRAKIHDIWQLAPDYTDIFVTHGPPKGILDHSYNQIGNIYERCGCTALLKRILKIQPKLCLFGHIHNTEDIINAGTVKLSAYTTIFSNGSVVTDGKFGQLSSNGNILEV